MVWNYIYPFWPRFHIVVLGMTFWPRFHIVVLGMTFFFLYPLIYFPYSIWTFISLFYLDFYLPFLFGLLFRDISRHFDLFSIFPISSDFGFLPNFFSQNNLFGSVEYNFIAWAINSISIKTLSWTFRSTWTAWFQTRSLKVIRLLNILLFARR